MDKNLAELVDQLFWILWVFHALVLKEANQFFPIDWFELVTILIV